MNRSISLKDRLSGLVKQAEEDDQSYQRYIKDAEKEGKTIIETGTKKCEEKKEVTPVKTPVNTPTLATPVISPMTPSYMTPIERKEPEIKKTPPTYKAPVVSVNNNN